MRKILGFVFYLFVVNVSFAGPKYDALYHRMMKSYTMNADGSMDYHFRKEIQLLNTASFDKYGETFIKYNPEWQTLTINESYTLRKDGSRVETPQNAFNPMLPYECVDCERFNDIREMVVTHTALELDATVVLDYTIHTVQPFIQDLMERVNLYENAPVERFEVSVTFPQTFILNPYVNYHENYISQIQKVASDSTVTMQWIFSNLQQKPSDAYLPSDYLPYLLLTTVQDPRDFMEKLCSQNAFEELSAAPYKHLLDEILMDKNTIMEQVMAIRDYVADNIHTNNLSVRYLNYILASPLAIWKTNCATPFEKNLLLNAMLRSIGVQSVFGIFQNTLLSDPESALQVTIEGEKYLITAANKHQRSLECTRAPLCFIAVNGNIYNFDRQPVKINAEADVVINRTAESTTADVNVLKSEISSPQTKTLILATQPAVTVDLQPLSGGYHALNLYGSPYSTSPQSTLIRRNRTLPLEINPCEESYVYNVILPSDAKCVSQPYEIKKNYDFGSILIELTVQGDRIIVRRNLTLSENRIANKKQIRDFRKMIAEWDVQRAIILSK